MKNILFWYIILLINGLFYSCKKVKLDPEASNETQTAIYNSQITVNGNVSNLIVGEGYSIESANNLYGNSSFISSVFKNDLNQEILKYEFVLPELFNESSLSNPIEFGDLKVNYNLSVNNLPNNEYISNYLWNVNNVFYNSDVPISNFGQYDVQLEFNYYGEPVQLNDRLIVGSQEFDEPQITINEISPYMYTFDIINSNPSQSIDSTNIVIKHNSSIIYLNPTIPVELPFESSVILCEFYYQGELINYSSKIIISSLSNYLITEINSELDLINSNSLLTNSLGSVSYLYNNKVYKSLPNKPFVFSFSNVETIQEYYTNDSYIKGLLNYSSYLYYNELDSIYVDLSSNVGFLKNPE